jgi:UDP-N-acetylmuramoyl-L-alanyl-D-glutamate--2,6-diaminopimelate ligase
MSNLSEILNPFLNDQFASEVRFENLRSVELNLNGATEEQIIFYRLAENDKAIAAFEKRLKDGKPGLLIIATELSQLNVDLNVPYILLSPEKTLPLQKSLCDFFYGELKDEKHLGITGTNGKTSTAFILMQALQAVGKKALFIGTIGLWDGKNKIADSSMTSPDYLIVRKIIGHYKKDFEFFVWEVSSHGLEQQRFYEVELEAAGWTNFTQDHLDYHGTLEEYFGSKLKIFKHLKNDQPLYLPNSQEKLMSDIKGKGFQCEAVNPPSDDQLTDAFWSCSYNKENLSLALKITENQTGELPSFAAINDFLRPPGRFNILEVAGKKIVIDYAHTPDALKNICEALKKSYPDENLTVIFGCGGDRDRNKRAQMGLIAQDSSDKVYVTTDNPRFEDPVQIIDDIVKGMPKNLHEVIVDRKEAIKKAIDHMSSNEVLLIAGKGHEPYMDIKGVKHPYSDEQWALECLNV